jgi:hypothetical protein
LSKRVSVLNTAKIDGVIEDTSSSHRATRRLSAGAQRAKADHRRQSTMKKLLILAFALAIGSSAFAQNGKISAKYSGIIEKYDAATKTLTVKRNDKQGEFVIADTVEVLQNKAKADVSALTAGQKVEVEFVMDGAKKMAQKVKISGTTANR